MKQIEYEKTQSLIAEADRAFELIGRAIRMAGYRHLQMEPVIPKTRANPMPLSFLVINKKVGFNGSDSLIIQHQLSNGMDFDCVGNVITKERTKNNLALQGFLVDRQAGISKGQKVNGGSLLCRSLDRQGRSQDTTLMNGVDGLVIDELNSDQAQIIHGQKLFRVQLKMTDGAKLNLHLERTFATRNL